MPNKNSKIARRTAGKASSNLPSMKDDGTRWQVVSEGKVVYLGKGITKLEAQRLSDGLIALSEIVQVI